MPDFHRCEKMTVLLKFIVSCVCVSVCLCVLMHVWCVHVVRVCQCAVCVYVGWRRVLTHAQV